MGSRLGFEFGEDYSAIFRVSNLRRSGPSMASLHYLATAAVAVLLLVRKRLALKLWGT
jgi:hypothetical protein